MAQPLRVILFTANADAAPELRRAVTSLPNVRIVAELDEPSLIGQAVSQFHCELIVADIDPSAHVVLECLRQLRETSPHLPVFALSKHTEGDVVLKAMKAGVREYLVKPLNLEEYQQAVSALAEITPKSKQPGKLVSIIGSSGGVGCTTLATNLAVELAEMVGSAGRVALVDLDFRFGHVATLLDVHGQYTVADLCSTPEQLDPQVVDKALVRHESGLFVLRRPHSFAQAEMITAAHCANVLSTLQEMCAYVVVDGPTRHDPGGRSVLDSADYIFLMLQLLVTNVRNTDRILQELAVQGFNTNRISILVNRLGRESAHLEVPQVETILNRKVFATIADDWKAVSCSVNIGRPLKYEYDRAKVRQDIHNIAIRLHCPEKYEADKPKQVSLFGKLLNRVHKHPEPPKPDQPDPTTPMAV
ncbi:MAG: response regulator [Planctomycetes bacterium]|nr:response regulator [Planctomycetota bacterium]